MPLRYESLSRKPRIFRKLTGMSLGEFEILMDSVRENLKKTFTHMGRPRRLASSEDKVLLLLIYYRSYATHEFLGYFVGLNDSNVCRLFKRLEPLMAKKIHITKDRTLTEDKIAELLLDVTEQPIQRPTKRKPRKNYYSGKKKRHTQKIEMTMTRDGKIIDISHSKPGREHDFKIRKQRKPLPPDADKYVDLGYQGLDKLSSHVLLPYKKPKGGKLTPEQKAYNREHSKVRIAIEHKFAQLKKFRILGETYRNFRRKHHLRFNIIAGIVNLQTGF
jgi:hypothetical protein